MFELLEPIAVNTPSSAVGALVWFVLPKEAHSVILQSCLSLFLIS
jgi:hypothetical protein